MTIEAGYGGTAKGMSEKADNSRWINQTLGEEFRSKDRPTHGLLTSCSYSRTGKSTTNYPAIINIDGPSVLMAVSRIHLLPPRCPNRLCNGQDTS